MSDPGLLTRVISNTKRIKALPPRAGVSSRRLAFIVENQTDCVIIPLLAYRISDAGGAATLRAGMGE